ncbi:hypothetical protein ACWDKQ_27850 [Saccharopolyspora sp. NPDC000995]
MLGLLFEDEASLETIREFGDHPDVIGFLVTYQRYAGVHRNEYMKLYAGLEERGLPLGSTPAPQALELRATPGELTTSTPVQRRVSPQRRGLFSYG